MPLGAWSTRTGISTRLAVPFNETLHSFFLQKHSPSVQGGSSLCFITREPLLFQTTSIFELSPVNNQPCTVNYCFLAEPCQRDQINSCRKGHDMMTGRKSGSLQDELICLLPCISDPSVAALFQQLHSFCISQKV